MASHDGLRLYLGKYAPDEVLKHIFEYGFHLWLAKPHEQCVQHEWAETTMLLVPRNAMAEQTWNRMYAEQIARDRQERLQRWGSE